MGIFATVPDNLINRWKLNNEQPILSELSCYICKFNDKIEMYKIYKANETGCAKCNAGYKGRMGIFEAIIMDNDIADLLSSGNILNERKIKELAIKQAIPTLREDGIIKVLKGETSYEEVASVVDLYEE